jgi:hypothetical protein
MRKKWHQLAVMLLENCWFTLMRRSTSRGEKIVERKSVVGSLISSGSRLFGYYPASDVEVRSVRRRRAIVRMCILRMFVYASSW